MNKLRKDFITSPKYNIALIVLLAIGLVSLPLERFFGLFINDILTAKLVGGIVIRAILSSVTIFLIIKAGFYRVFVSGSGIFAFLAVIPALLVVINNFPIIAFISGKATITGDTADKILYAIYCLSVGLFEETVFCGLVFPLCTFIYKENKYGVLFSVVTTAGIFSFSHLINLFGGASVGATIMQIGYSFLIGAMCAIALSVTKNLFTAIVLHFIYDLGGLIFSNVGIAYGSQWDTITIIITVILGVLSAIYFTILLMKTDFNKVKSLYIDGKTNDL